MATEGLNTVSGRASYENPSPFLIQNHVPVEIVRFLIYIRFITRFGNMEGEAKKCSTQPPGLDSGSDKMQKESLTKIRPDPAAKYFSCTNKERAAFEAGIKLGALCHQFSGTPLTSDSVSSLERAMEDAARVLPCVEDVKVKIDRAHVPDPKGLNATVLLENMLDIRLVTSCGDAKAAARMKYIPELDFPLMYVESIENLNE